MVLLIVLMLMILASCNQDSEHEVYDDVEHYLIKELEEQGESGIKISDKDKTSIEELDGELYEASGEVFNEEDTLLATFKMELKYSDDRLDYKWETEPINDDTSGDLADEQNEDTTEEYNPLDILNELATYSEDIDEVYITEDLVVGEKEEVNPGIYDLEVVGGSGNLSGSRANPSSLHLNWALGEKGNSGGYPSKVRLILFEGDTLKFRDISKVKFNAISEEVESSNELGIGEFIVGRDITPGEYKLSTNVDMNPDFENLGWDIRIYNDENGESRDQKFTATNDDVLVKLEEGEVVSTSYSNTDHGSSSDDAKLIFTEE